MPTQKESGEILALIFLYGHRMDGPPVSGCCALQKLRLIKQACFLQTAAHTAPSLFPPQAAVGLAAIPNTEVKLICADNTWRATAREDR